MATATINGITYKTNQRIYLKGGQPEYNDCLAQDRCGTTTSSGPYYFINIEKNVHGTHTGAVATIGISRWQQPGDGASYFGFRVKPSACPAKQTTLTLKIGDKETKLTKTYGARLIVPNPTMDNATFVKWEQENQTGDNPDGYESKDTTSCYYTSDADVTWTAVFTPIMVEVLFSTRAVDSTTGYGSISYPAEDKGINKLDDSQSGLLKIQYAYNSPPTLSSFIPSTMTSETDGSVDFIGWAPQGSIYLGGENWDTETQVQGAVVLSYGASTTQNINSVFRESPATANPSTSGIIDSKVNTYYAIYAKKNNVIQGSVSFSIDTSENEISGYYYNKSFPVDVYSKVKNSEGFIKDSEGNIGAYQVNDVSSWDCVLPNTWSPSVVDEEKMFEDPTLEIKHYIPQQAFLKNAPGIIFDKWIYDTGKELNYASGNYPCVSITGSEPNVTLFAVFKLADNYNFISETLEERTFKPHYIDGNLSGESNNDVDPTPEIKDENGNPIEQSSDNTDDE